MGEGGGGGWGGDVSSKDKARGSHPSRGAHFSGALLGSEGDTIMCAVLCVCSH